MARSGYENDFISYNMAGNLNKIDALSEVGHGTNWDTVSLSGFYYLPIIHLVYYVQCKDSTSHSAQ